MRVSPDQSYNVTMRKFLDDLDLAHLPFAYSPTAVLALPGKLDTVAARLVYHAVHAMAEKFALCQRKYLRLVVIHMRRATARPIQPYAVDVFAGWLIRGL